jgi:ribonuclease P protein subunit RPR2
MPGMDGIEVLRRLKDDPGTAAIPVILLSGGEATGAGEAAEAFLTKPFSPLQLLAAAERLAGEATPAPLSSGELEPSSEPQLLLYARDLRRVLEIERGQRALLQDAYHDTVLALASALESKDTGTREHSQRVQSYAVALATCIDDGLVDDPALEYGFLLHDVGKIGIPDAILQKPGPLDRAERQLMETHTILGEQVLSSVAFLQGDGVAIVRSHHERWDGCGYPDGLAGTDIPLGARVFAVADTLDAMTSDRPYRRALTWADAGCEIRREAGGQFDPDVVRAFAVCEPELREIHGRFAAAV